MCATDGLGLSYQTRNYLAQVISIQLSLKACDAKTYSHHEPAENMRSLRLSFGVCIGGRPMVIVMSVSMC